MSDIDLEVNELSKLYLLFVKSSPEASDILNTVTEPSVCLALNFC